MITSVKSIKNLDFELSVLDLNSELQIECKEMTQVIQWILTKRGIEHSTYTGYVVDNLTDDIVFPHCWIVLNDTGYIVDYRLRMWLGDTDDIPHGIFQNIKRFSYCGATFVHRLSNEAVSEITHNAAQQIA